MVASQASTTRRTQATAYFFTAGQLGLFLGPVFAGILLQLRGRPGVILLPLLALIVFLLDWRWLPPTAPPHGHDHASSTPARTRAAPRGFLALLDGKPVGLVHYMDHRTTWTVSNNCYLQDLFTAPEARGSGVGAALIAEVGKAAAERGITNVYWMTQDTNATARRLYDRVAKHHGFIRYNLA